MDFLKLLSHPSGAYGLSPQERRDAGFKRVGWCKLPPLVTVHGIPTRVACRHCEGCMKAAKQARTGVLVAEGLTSAAVWAATLTYAPGQLGADFFIKDHIQDLMKRFRKKYAKQGISIRYASAGELGEERGRVHWHALFYFDKVVRPPFIEVNEKWDLWPFGWSRLDYVHGLGSSHDLVRSVRYVVKYALKDSGEEFDNRFLYSRFPPLGYDWYMRDAARRAAAGEIHDGFMRFGGVRWPDGKHETFPILSKLLLEEVMDCWCENYSGNLADVPGDVFPFPFIRGQKGISSWLDQGVDTRNRPAEPITRIYRSGKSWNSGG